MHRRYRGRESFRLLREAIDQVTVDHGETRIEVGGMPYPVKDDNSVTTGKVRKRKKAMSP
jgi:hypothetical protein